MYTLYVPLPLTPMVAALGAVVPLPARVVLNDVGSWVGDCHVAVLVATTAPELDEATTIIITGNNAVGTKDGTIVSKPVALIPIPTLTGVTV